MAQELPAEIRAWVPRQRWFAGKGREPVLRVVQLTEQRLDRETFLQEWLLQDDSDERNSPYYVPVTVRESAPEGFRHARIDDRETPPFLFDAPHDPAYALRLLRAATEHSPTGPLNASASTVLTGEQSNTSVLYWTREAPESGPPHVIVKVFRRLDDGESPDVVLQTALSAARVERVPHAIGSITFDWKDRVGLARRGHVAFAQEFVSGVEDAWRVTLRALAQHEDVTHSLEELGAATAEVHAALARLFPTDLPTPQRIGGLVRGMRERSDAALQAVPALEPFRERIHHSYSRLSFASWPALQRIHGDYHLGQVLLAPDRGWLLVDFEGEPLRPLSDRNSNDVPLRDVAGMLRSLDYAAAASEAAGHTAEAGWTQRARSAFVVGYNSVATWSARAEDEVLRALELDKALYEALYDAGNRPEWLHIPLAAVQRLARSAASDQPGHP